MRLVATAEIEPLGPCPLWNGGVVQPTESAPAGSYRPVRTPQTQDYLQKQPKERMEISRNLSKRFIGPGTWERRGASGRTDRASPDPFARSRSHGNPDRPNGDRDSAVRIDQTVPHRRESRGSGVTRSQSESFDLSFRNESTPSQPREAAVMFETVTGDVARLAFTRRQALQAGFLGLGGLSLAEALRCQAAAASPVTDTAVILFFLHGGPSHLETYDLKPKASSEIRGPYQPMATRVPGLEICEHLPRHAQVADKFVLLRSCTHDEADHFAGHRRFLSGYGTLKPGTGYESFYPQMGAVANRLAPSSVAGMPSAIAINGVVVNGPDYAAGVSEGYWSPMYRVPIVNGSLMNASLTVEPQRLLNRRSLQQGLDRLHRQTDLSGLMDAGDEFDRQALEILMSGRVERAFDLTREDPRLRAKYGEGEGQELLTARRLVEAGVRFVTVCSRGHGPDSMAHNWDDHAVNWDLDRAMRLRLPQYDQQVATLIEDLYDRGLDQRVLLIVTGEFGRTPRLEFQNGRIGRDHWPGAMSMLLSGGGLPTGSVYGATDGIGARPHESPFDPQDLLATVYRHLGIDPQTHISDPQGRPIALSTGKPLDLW
jgi:hypothetical protein